MVLEIFLTFDPFPGWAISLGLIRGHVANTNYLVGSDKVVRLVIFEGDVAWEGGFVGQKFIIYGRGANANWTFYSSICYVLREGAKFFVLHEGRNG